MTTVSARCCSRVHFRCLAVVVVFILSLMTILLLTFLEGRRVSQGVTNLLSNFGFREFRQLSLFHFVKFGTDFVDDSVYKGPDKPSLSMSTIGSAVLIEVQSDQNAKPAIPDIVKSDTASPTNDIVRTQCIHCCCSVLLLFVVVITGIIVFGLLHGAIGFVCRLFLLLGIVLLLLLVNATLSIMVVARRYSYCLIHIIG